MNTYWSLVQYRSNNRKMRSGNKRSCIQDYSRKQLREYRLVFVASWGLFDPFARQDTRLSTLNKTQTTIFSMLKRVMEGWTRTVKYGNKY